MGQNRKTQWQLKLTKGRVIGPYSTPAVLKLIREGSFSGEEYVRNAAGGEWFPISHEAEFYDALIEAIHRAPTEKSKKDLVDVVSQETVISSLPPEALLPIIHKDDAASEKPQGNFEETRILLQHPLRVEEEKSVNHSLALRDAPFSAGSNGSQAGGPPSAVVELHKFVPPPDEKRKIRSAIFGATLFIFAAALIYFATAPSGVPRDERVRLLAPTAEGFGLGPDAVESDFKKALAYFQVDTFEGYFLAQQQLVSLLEKSPTHKKARGFLCLVHRELWPFAHQDSKDVDAINNHVKATKAIDPIGIAGAYCEISKLLTFGKIADARGIVDFQLNQKNDSTDPVLVLLKSEIISIEQDNKSAATFAEIVSQHWPEWVKPHFLRGDFLMQSGQTQSAAQAFENVLKMNHKHKGAQIQFAVINYRFFRQIDLALDYLTVAVSSPDRVSRALESKAFFTLAQIWSDKKDEDRAIKFAQKAFNLNPNDPEYRDFLVKLGGNTEAARKNLRHTELIFLGDQYFRSGDCLSAQAEYKTAFEIDPTNALAATKAARCLWKLNQASEAIKWLEKAIRADVKFIEAYVTLADYLAQRYNYQESLRVLSQASGHFPNNNEILRGFGHLEFRRNNIKDAINFLNKANKVFEKDVDTLLLLARSHGAIGEFEQAQKYAIRALELDSTNNEAIVVYAKNLVQFQGLDSGLFYIKDQISKYSYTIEFRQALGEIYASVERFQDAQKVFEQIVSADPKNKKAYLGLGESYQAQAMFDAALRSFLSAAMLDPSDAEPPFKIGMLYIEMNRFTESIQYFSMAIQVNPLYPRANFFAGRAAYLNGDYQVALDFAKKERMTNPNLADSYILGAEVYTAMRDYRQCASEYQQAVRLRPQGAEIYVKMAQCYRQSGSPDVAESMLSIASSIESGLPEIFRELGAIYEARGDLRSAVTAYARYRALSPNAPDRKYIDSRISALGNGD